MKRPSLCQQPAITAWLLLILGSLPSCDAGGSSTDDESPDPGVEVCTPGNPFPWSCEFKNTCPDLVELAPEPYRPSKPPMEAGATPRLLWADAESCPEFPYAKATPMAYMETEVEGVLREVVVMLLSGGSANTLSDVIQAISLNDANTGELVACYPFPVADHRAEFDPLPVVSELGRFFITASTEQGELGLAPHTTIWSDGPGVGPRVLKGYQSSDVTTIFLNGHRELVAVVDESLVGLSIENGEPYWIQQTTGDRPVNGIARPGRTAQTLWTSAETHLFLRTYDQCGVPTGEEVVGWTVLPIWNANVIRTEAGGTVVMVDGVETVSEACYNHIQVNDNLVTCFASKKDGFSLVSFDLAGTWRSEFPLTSQVINLEFGRGLVAGPDNTVIFSVRDPDLRFHTMAVDVVTNEVKWTLTFQDDEARYSKGILTPRGVLIMSRGAIQTDVFGLAPTYYPRGWVGGNENRGYVALPE